MPISDQFTGRNYWGLVQQNGPWKMTGRDYANQVNMPVTPGPAGQDRYSGHSTVSFKDNFNVMPGAPDVSTSRYTQYSIVSGQGRAMVPAPNPAMPGGNLGWQSNTRPGEEGYNDPATKLNMDGDAFAISLDNELADKPLYPKPGQFISQQFLIEKALEEQNSSAMEMNDAERQALSEDFYDHVLGGVAPLRGKVDQGVKRLGPNLVQTVTVDAFGEQVYNEHFTPTRGSIEAGLHQLQSSLQPRVDEELAAYSAASHAEAYNETIMAGQVADPFNYK